MSAVDGLLPVLAALHQRHGAGGDAGTRLLGGLERGRGALNAALSGVEEAQRDWSALDVAALPAPLRTRLEPLGPPPTHGPGGAARRAGRSRPAGGDAPALLPARAPESLGSARHRRLCRDDGAAARRGRPPQPHRVPVERQGRRPPPWLRAAAAPAPGLRALRQLVLPRRQLVARLPHHGRAAALLLLAGAGAHARRRGRLRQLPARPAAPGHRPHHGPRHRAPAHRRQRRHHPRLLCQLREQWWPGRQQRGRRRGVQRRLSRPEPVTGVPSLRGGARHRDGAAAAPPDAVGAGRHAGGDPGASRLGRGDRPTRDKPSVTLIIGRSEYIARFEILYCYIVMYRLFSAAVVSILS